mmetsp:Transcript_626/g.2320  ORF Transcript_626/g.2320 Transcript_626/m.2320 type:complete len:320 (+) Transcript_626:2828-3787(+)
MPRPVSCLTLLPAVPHVSLSWLFRVLVASFAAPAKQVCGQFTDHAKASRPRDHSVGFVKIRRRRRALQRCVVHLLGFGRQKGRSREGVGLSGHLDRSVCAIPDAQCRPNLKWDNRVRLYYAAHQRYFAGVDVNTVHQRLNLYLRHENVVAFRPRQMRVILIKPELDAKRFPPSCRNDEELVPRQHVVGLLHKRANYVSPFSADVLISILLRTRWLRAELQSLFPCDAWLYCGPHLLSRVPQRTRTTRLLLLGSVNLYTTWLMDWRTLCTVCRALAGHLALRFLQMGHGLVQLPSLADGARRQFARLVQALLCMHVVPKR